MHCVSVGEAWAIWISLNLRVACAQQVNKLLSNGCNISVIADDGARIRRSYERDAILPAMMSTDAESIYVYGPGYNSSADHTVKAVFLVYGNDGYDVINDYSSSLAPLIVRTLALVNDLSSAGR